MSNFGEPIPRDLATDYEVLQDVVSVLIGRHVLSLETDPESRSQVASLSLLSRNMSVTPESVALSRRILIDQFGLGGDI